MSIQEYKFYRSLVTELLAYCNSQEQMTCYLTVNKGVVPIYAGGNIGMFMQVVDRNLLVKKCFEK